MRTILFAAFLIALAGPAQAYTGPGLGLGVLGVIFGFLGTIALGIIGLVWYPLKRALAARRKQTPGQPAP